MQLFNLLSKEEKERGKIISVKKGETLFHEGEKCHYVGILLSGGITISSFTLSGQQIVYNIIEKGDMFGNNLLFSDNSSYRGDVIATSDGSVFLINKENLLKIMQNNGIFLENYLNLQANFSKKLNFNLKILSLSSARERFLYYLDERQSIRYKSISALANSLYLTRETLSRLISELVKEGKIEKKDNLITWLK